MMSTQFRVLYREFLFRIVDRELLSTYANGDMSKLLLRFVSLLIFMGLSFAVPAAMMSSRQPPEAILLSSLNTIDSLIATTMLAVGLFAILSWNTIFPDRLDALVLTPLPVPPRTIFLAKIAAVATGLGVAVLSLNAAPSVLWPLRLQTVLPAAHGVGVGVIRLFVAYWITMLAAGLFISCLVIGLQGLAATLLPRHAFLRTSSYLQLATFVILITTYFLLPTGITPHPFLLAPWYWFLAFFQGLSGMSPIGPVARYAWWGLGASVCITMIAYTLSYFRTLRTIEEESDITPTARLNMAQLWPRFGTARQTAIVLFSMRTLLRSTQQRVILAFYWGIGFAVTTLFLTAMRRGAKSSLSPLSTESLWHERSVPLIVSSVVMLMTAVLGARVVFALPRDLRANWIFRIMPLPGGTEYLGARRRALFALSAAPVLALSAVVFLASWPTIPAAGHLVVLWLLGSILVELYLYGTRKIPFTCSYLPGKSTFQAAFWVALLFVLVLTMAFGLFERRALDSPALYATLLIVLATAYLSARATTTLQARSADALPQFEEEPSDRIVSLDVWDHRFALRQPDAGGVGAAGKLDAV
jgi:hypothetical protein